MGESLLVRKAGGGLKVNNGYEVNYRIAEGQTIAAGDFVNFVNYRIRSGWTFDSRDIKQLGITNDATKPFFVKINDTKTAVLYIISSVLYYKILTLEGNNFTVGSQLTLDSNLSGTVNNIVKAVFIPRNSQETEKNNDLINDFLFYSCQFGDTTLVHRRSAYNYTNDTFSSPSGINSTSSFQTNSLFEVSATPGGQVMFAQVRNINPQLNVKLYFANSSSGTIWESNASVTVQNILHIAGKVIHYVVNTGSVGQTILLSSNGSQSFTYGLGFNNTSFFKATSFGNAIWIVRNTALNVYAISKSEFIQYDGLNDQGVVQGQSLFSTNFPIHNIMSRISDEAGFVGYLSASPGNFNAYKIFRLTNGTFSSNGTTNTGWSLSSQFNIDTDVTNTSFNVGEIAPEKYYVAYRKSDTQWYVRLIDHHAVGKATSSNNIDGIALEGGTAGQTIKVLIK
jgi:hypothetical protein